LLAKPHPLADLCEANVDADLVARLGFNLDDQLAELAARAL